MRRAVALILSLLFALSPLQARARTVAEPPGFAEKVKAKGDQLLVKPVLPLKPAPGHPVTLFLPEGVTDGVGVLVAADGNYTPLPTKVVPRGAGFAAAIYGGVGLHAVVARSRSFTDLEGREGKAEVEFLASRLIVEGIDPTTFGPDQFLTRAQFAALLVRTLGLGPRPERAGRFTDISPQDWYAGSVGAAVEAGLIAGYEDETFRPNQPLSRVELFILLDRAARRLPGPAVETPADATVQQALEAFSDQAAIPGWARQAVGRAAALGLTPEQVGALRPGDKANRLEAARGIYRLLALGGFAPANR